MQSAIFLYQCGKGALITLPEISIACQMTQLVSARVCRKLSANQQEVRIFLIGFMSRAQPTVLSVGVYTFRSSDRPVGQTVCPTGRSDDRIV